MRSAPPLPVHETHLDEVLVVSVDHVRLDARIAVAFKNYVVQRIEAGERRLVLDLSRVSFIDSSGLGAVVTGLKALGRDGTLVLAGVREPAAEIFRLTRMDRVFEIYDDVDAAVQAIA